MCDWFTFEIGHGEVIIHVNMQVIIETQPVDIQSTDDFCESVMFPVIDQLRQVCIEKEYSQRCVVNLEGTDVKRMNPVVFVRIINNVYNHAKDTPENLIKAVEIQNANSLFRTLYYASSYFLPTYMVNLLTIS